MIYLDNAATTRVDDRVVAAMLPYYTECYGNPATQYNIGLDAAEGVAIAREQVATLIGCSPLEIFFTSGGTESDNWAIIGSFLDQKKPYIVISAIEHHAISHTAKWVEKNLGAKVETLPVDKEGIVSPMALGRFLLEHKDEISIVSIMHANNEIGTVLPIDTYASICHKFGVLFHTDAVQSAGKIPLDVKELGVDLLSISSHKIHGPKGVGALYVRKGVDLEVLISGGGQEMEMRSGTTNVPGIVGFGEAADIARNQLSLQCKIDQLGEQLSSMLLNGLPGSWINGSKDSRVKCNVNITIPGIEANKVVDRLNEIGICAATGSACNCDDPEPSHVLTAIGLTPDQAHASLRLTLGRYNDSDDIVEAANKIIQIVRELY